MHGRHVLCVCMYVVVMISAGGWRWELGMYVYMWCEICGIVRGKVWDGSGDGKQS